MRNQRMERVQKEILEKFMEDSENGEITSKVERNSDISRRGKEK